MAKHTDFYILSVILECLPVLLLELFESIMSLNKNLFFSYITYSLLNLDHFLFVEVMKLLVVILNVF